MNNRWMIAPAIALLGLALAFTACGGDDNTSSSTPTPTAIATESNATSTLKATASPKKTSTPKASATSNATGTPEASTANPFETPNITECDLVKPDDLGLLANDTFSAGIQEGDTCTFTGTAGTLVTIETYDFGEHPKDQFEALAVVFGDDILNSPGDEAYYDADLGLAILQGSIELDIYVNDAVDGTRNRASAFAVSDVALPNLP